MAALIVPDFEILEKDARQNKIIYNTRQELLPHEFVQDLYSKEIRTFSREVASAEMIRDSRLIDHEFGIETGELTPTLKVKPRVIEERFKDLIDDIFKA